MALAKETAKTPPTVRPRQILICQYKSCVAASSPAVLTAFQQQSPSGVEIIAAPCQGQCSSGPTVRVLPDEIWYCRVGVEDVPQIVEEHLLGDSPVQQKLHPRIHQPYGF